jgi:hypothetical protein
MAGYGGQEPGPSSASEWMEQSPPTSPHYIPGSSCDAQFAPNLVRVSDPVPLMNSFAMGLGRFLSLGLWGRRCRGLSFKEAHETVW